MCVEAKGNEFENKFVSLFVISLKTDKPMNFGRMCLAGALLLMAGGVAAKNVKVNYVVTNPGNETRKDEPVAITVSAPWVKSVTVYAEGKEIPSQLDDLDRDGKFDELAFVVDLAPREQKELKIVYSDKRVAADRYPSRVHAQMFLKDPKTKELIAKDVVTATEDNMYNKLHHHGPAFESDMIAYRIYFDKKQTIDIYGKKNKGLELTETMWYPTDEQLAKGMGDDIIRVFGSVGVGALKGWDNIGQRAIHIEPMTQREARIVAKGPVRTVVEMEVKGWKYNGRSVDMNSRYILWAGHRDVQVQNILGGNLKNLVFCTGVMKMAEHTSYVDDRGVAAVWGTDYPVNDTVKYPKQTCGLAVAIAPEYVKERHDDKINYLYLLQPDARGRIDYRMTVAAEKENFGYKNADQFFDYVKKWAETLPVRVGVGRMKMVTAADGITRERAFVAEEFPRELAE